MTNEKSTEKALTPITASSLTNYSPEEQKEIVALADKIDVTNIEKIIAYGQIPLLASFESAGAFLKEMQGTSADEKVIADVLKLSELANKAYDDFNLEISEPSIIQKILLKLSTGAKSKKNKELKLKAISCYKLLEQLVISCDQWIKDLQDAYSKILSSSDDDVATCTDLEKYLLAGKIAEERIAKEIETAEAKFQDSGLIEDQRSLEVMREGQKTLVIVLLNLEKSRGALAISLGQLFVALKSNRNIQIAVRTQRANSMALAAQQLRNALLNAQNQLALDGQKSLTGLNSELLKSVSTNTIATAEESEKILLNGVYSVESALEAAKTVIDGCARIEAASHEHSAKVTEELDKLETLITELKPVVSKLDTSSSGSPSDSQSKKTKKSELKF